MKIMKRLATLLLTLCLVVPSFAVVVNAEEGRVSFTDPKTKTGETFEVVCALRSNSAAELNSFDVTLKYDPSFIAYESGDAGVTKESDGVIKFSGKGDGSGRIGFTMKFQALQVGTTKIEVTDSKGDLVANSEVVNCSNGNSTIEIAQGTEPVTPPADTTDTTDTESGDIVIGDKSYTFSEDFQSSEIPVGFADATITYDGAERKVVQNENGSIKLGYLMDSEGKGAFFLYNEENATFAPYVQVTVSAATSIVLLTKDETVKVPEGYAEVKLTVNEHEFPAWQDTKHEGFYLVYAMSPNGTKGFYQYDREEESYQRFIMAEAVSSDKKVEKASKLAEVIEDNLSLVVLAVGLGAILLVIILIVLAVKLHNRNVELDDLYDEYDIDDEDDDVMMIKEDKKEKKSPFKKESKKEAKKEEFLDDDFADLSDDFDDDFADLDDDFDTDFDDFDDDFDDDFLDSDDDDDFGKIKKAPKDEDEFEDFDDDFEIDYIDLD